MNVWKIIWDTMREAGGIALLVAGMMTALALINYSSKGRIVLALKKTRFGQVLLASALGAVPGCMGGFLAVSMYAHGMLGFGALAAMMLATTGDEAFLMLARFPGTALLIMAGLFAAALVFGLCFGKGGVPGGEEQAVSSHKPLKERLLEILPDAGKVFLWTFAVMLAVNIAQNYINLEAWLNEHSITMILLAIAVGFIPQSGPHMIFVTMYAAGMLPLPVLLANCIVQDGHAGLPLLAADRKAFLKIKAAKAIIALAVSAAVLLLS